MQAKQEQIVTAAPARWTLMICVLGNFQLLRAGQPVIVPLHGKAQAFLSTLALRYRQPVRREIILESLWPDTSSTLAGQSLNSLVYTLHKQLGQHIGGALPVVHTNGYYRLNQESGITTDLAYFEALISKAEQWRHRGDAAAAMLTYTQAISLYHGDLTCDSDLQASIERERLRACYLNVLAWLADYHYERHEYATSLNYAHQLLLNDSCREDAHRLVMRCYVRRNERAQALRQYHLCASMLRAEFDTTPEPATLALFERIRLTPESI
ncbi:MAG TPA: BTAD domain-containing putative transcriptional regulator [Herpetosiphonaceae bacterium]